jgi:hypothetical protein
MGQMETVEMAEGSEWSEAEELGARMDTLVQAFSEEVARLLGLYYGLERRVVKFERIFERAFREEAESRLGLGPGAPDQQMARGKDVLSGLKVGSARPGR